MSIFNDKHLLIYDDCEFMGRSLHCILSAFEIGQLTICHDWKDAEYYIKKIKYDCIISDWSGWPDPELKCLEYVRYSGKANDPSTPVVLCTGKTTLPDVVESRDKGCTEIITKPISPSHVFDKIYAAIYKPRKFVVLENFTGPDRRRVLYERYTGLERRSDVALGPSDIDRLLAGENVETS